MATNILFVGDVVGGLGKRTLLGLLPSLRERLELDFVVVNGENIAGGIGITPKLADQLFDGGADVITLGNHTYRQREIYRYLDEHDEILRPANFLRSQPGHGWCVVEARRRAGSGSCRCRATCSWTRAGPPSPRPTRRCTRSATRPTTCSSTCTRRRPARRSRSAGTWTAA